MFSTLLACSFAAFGSAESFADVVIEKPSHSRSLFRALLDKRYQAESPRGPASSSLSGDLRVRIHAPDHDEKRFIAELESLRT
jgi:hypothetical protein